MQPTITTTLSSIIAYRRLSGFGPWYSIFSGVHLGHFSFFICLFRNLFSLCRSGNGQPDPGHWAMAVFHFGDFLSISLCYSCLLSLHDQVAGYGLPGRLCFFLLFHFEVYPCIFVGAILGNVHRARMDGAGAMSACILGSGFFGGRAGFFLLSGSTTLSGSTFFVFLISLSLSLFLPRLFFFSFDFQLSVLAYLRLRFPLPPSFFSVILISHYEPSLVILS